ncbi:hypothetical protein ACFSQ7_32295 [Paenibacillus rhizoplanae]
MYRLLIVDDEEIITDGLYEAFNQLLPDKLDVYKVYSAKSGPGVARTHTNRYCADGYPHARHERAGDV